MLRYPLTNLVAVTTNVELCVRDSSGNVTVLSTHSGQRHVIQSYNAYTGEGRVIDIDAIGSMFNALLSGANLAAVISDARANGITNVMRTTSRPKEVWKESVSGAKPTWLVEYEKSRQAAGQSDDGGGR